MGVLSKGVNILKRILFIFVSITIIFWWNDYIEYVCPIYQHLGIYCSMCKATRATKLLLEGQVLNGFLMNPLVFVWLFLLGLSYLDFCMKTCFREDNVVVQMFHQCIYLKIEYYLSSRNFQKIFGGSMILNMYYLNWGVIYVL